MLQELAPAWKCGSNVKAQGGEAFFLDRESLYYWPWLTQTEILRAEKIKSRRRAPSKRTSRLLGAIKRAPCNRKFTTSTFQRAAARLLDRSRKIYSALRSQNKYTVMLQKIQVAFPQFQIWNQMLTVLWILQYFLGKSWERELLKYTS